MLAHHTMHTNQSYLGRKFKSEVAKFKSSPSLDNVVCRSQEVGLSSRRMSSLSEMKQIKPQASNASSSATATSTATTATTTRSEGSTDINQDHRFPSNSQICQDIQLSSDSKIVIDQNSKNTCKSICPSSDKVNNKVPAKKVATSARKFLSRAASSLSGIVDISKKQSSKKRLPASNDQSIEDNNDALKTSQKYIAPNLSCLQLPLCCLIKSLDDKILREVFVHRFENGQYLLDNLTAALNIRDDCKFFGLKIANSISEQENFRCQWLKLDESVFKQVKKLSVLASGKRTIKFYLRIKFYPPTLEYIQDTFLLKYLYLQLRRDLRMGKLTSSENNLISLMAFVLQYELGDADLLQDQSENSCEELSGKIRNLSIVPIQSLIEYKAIEVWVKSKGLSQEQAELSFLRLAVLFETYGFQDFLPVKDHLRDEFYFLGFNYSGIKTIKDGQIVNNFSWSRCTYTYEKRMLIFHLDAIDKAKVSFEYN